MVLLVLTETALAAALRSAVTGGLCTAGTPTAAEVITIVASGLACTAVVVSNGMASSVRRPHRPGPRAPRDAVAPPLALALEPGRYV